MICIHRIRIEVQFLLELAKSSAQYFDPQNGLSLMYWATYIRINNNKLSSRTEMKYTYL